MLAKPTLRLAAVAEIRRPVELAGDGRRTPLQNATAGPIPAMVITEISVWEEGAALVPGTFLTGMAMAAPAAAAPSMAAAAGLEPVTSELWQEAVAVVRAIPIQRVRPRA